MDERTELYIALGAATAANCVPCFEHYFAKAEVLGITAEDMEQTVKIAARVRGGAGMVMKDSIRKILKNEVPKDEQSCRGTEKCCE